jgi:tRNA U38,U39,U40 pseudouridine synthase TruA
MSSIFSLREQDLIYFLEHASPTPAKYTAPPSGLFLERIIFKENERLPELTSTFKLNTKAELTG